MEYFLSALGCILLPFVNDAYASVSRRLVNHSMTERVTCGVITGLVQIAIVVYMIAPALY
jgi:hypothetical protein